LLDALNTAFKDQAYARQQMLRMSPTGKTKEYRSH